jgi:hypothetical protein
MFQVPVIAVFTKYDQFMREISFKLEDEGHDTATYLEHEADTIFRKHFLFGITKFVRLQSEDFLINYHVLY